MTIFHNIDNYRAHNKDKTVGGGNGQAVEGGDGQNCERTRLTEQWEEEPGK